MASSKILQIPIYTIDERFIKAIRTDNISYVKGKIDHMPVWLTTYFFHEGNLTENGIFSQIIFPPAKYILTPVGFATLYSSNNVLQYLLQKGSNPSSPGIIVDCPTIDPKLRWKTDLYRMHETYPVCLTLPNKQTFDILLMYGFDLASKLKMRFRLVSPNENKQRTENVIGIWELCWIFWKDMRTPKAIVQTTEGLILKGMDITKAIARVNLIQLFDKGFKHNEQNEDVFPDKLSGYMALKFLELLHFNGCQFQKTRISENLRSAICILYDYFIKIEETELSDRIKILARGIYVTTRRFRKSIIKKSTNLPDFLKDLITNEPLTLQSYCILCIRKSIGSSNFVKNVKKLPLKENLITSIMKGGYKS